MLKQILAAGALTSFMAGCANAEKPAASMAANEKAPAAQIAVAASGDFAETLARAQSAIESRGFKTFAVVDHTKGAASIGETLAPAALIIFGNPKGGTPFMQEDIRFGLELPLRLFVYEKDGAVYVSHPDYRRIAAPYALGGASERLEKVMGALGAISAEAAAL